MRTRRDFDPALPEPDAEARAHAERVRQALVAALGARGGWMPMREYVGFALYAPGLGYYAAGARKLGAAGDFTTAPEMSPLFGAALAAQIAPILAATRARELVELGGGSGRLAVDLLRELERLGAAPTRCVLVETSPDLRERQRETIAHALPEWWERVEWRDAPPERIDGAIVMNEVLDAIPPDVVARVGGRWYERGVTLDRHGALCVADRALDDPALEALARDRFPPEVDYASEIPRAAEALVEELGRRLAGGALLAIDYGFPRREFYHPERSGGTMMAHYRHRATPDLFVWPGLADLSSHVDFTGVAEAGARAGVGVGGYASQAAFLLGCGVLDRLAQAGEPASSEYLRAAGAVQTLLSPAEMGELFKVIALERGESVDWFAFRGRDASHRL